MKVTPCRAGCGTLVRFIRYEKPPHKFNPIEMIPTPSGNLRIDEATETYAVMTGADLDQARRDGVDLYLSHFATCPERNRFRNNGGNE